MAVSVVARQITIVQPENLLKIESIFQIVFYLMARHCIVSVWCQQAKRCGEERTFSVAFNGTAFQNEVTLVYIVTVQNVLAEKLAVDKVILVGSEFHTPSVETEIKQLRVAMFVFQCNECVVSCPSVVSLALKERDILFIWKIFECLREFRCNK